MKLEIPWDFSIWYQTEVQIPSKNKYAQAKAARELQMKYLQVYPELKQVCLNKAIEQILSGC